MRLEESVARILYLPHEFKNFYILKSRMNLNSSLAERLTSELSKLIASLTPQQPHRNSVVFRS